jgi:predicted RNA binding protein YcfA (HicA-like mRNA interferase family)
MVRQRGGHIVMQKKTATSTITVPIPNHKEIKIGTLKSIIRQSQVPSADFET